LNPHYYLMKSKKILRLEGDTSFSSLPFEIRAKALHPSDIESFDQNQANWRVVIFRDEIMEYDEYVEWLSTPEALYEAEAEFELVAN